LFQTKPKYLHPCRQVQDDGCDVRGVFGSVKLPL
jgi:hypothetical protein